ncbi:MAG: amino acid permease [Acidimicrobiales bacterium]
MTLDTTVHQPDPEAAAPAGGATAPRRATRRTDHLVEVPESFGYRLKSKVLGKPLPTEALEHERLGIPVALAVFSSDCLSSSAYATEEILRVLWVSIGVLAFSMIVPITIAMIGVLFFLILSYRETIREYPTAGGAYMVTRDNFGIMPAQVAGVSLLTDYILTVAVSTAAGTAALVSFFPSLESYSLLIALGFVALIAFGNLKGVKESGFAFAIPTYFFIGIMFLMLIVGAVKGLNGDLHPITDLPKGQLKPGTHGVKDAFFFGATLYVVLHAFASGGTAVTGVEAISNGVTAFKKPEWKNARKALVIMGSTLAVLFFGLSWIASKIHPVPTESGIPTVIAQVGKSIFGGGPLYALLQAGTVLILVLAANTSFADFPRLASFHAGDNFMPKQLTKRGHRLVFSNGILMLAITAAILLVVTDAKVERLIPLYAIGVFTSFTMSQAGMARHHLTKKEKGWQKGIFVNGFGAVLSLVVDIIFLITKFTHGAWVILLIVPAMVYGLSRLNKQYVSEEIELERDAPTLATAPTMRRHVALVMVDSLDVASARALQYARTLHPDQLRAVHLDLDPIRTQDLTEAWGRLGFEHFPLDVVECPDRRPDRVTAEIVARELLDGQTEVTVLLPRREYPRAWQRLFHDHTADQIAKPLTGMAHCNVTIVPFHMGATEVSLAGSTDEDASPNGATAGSGRSRRSGGTTTAPRAGIDLGTFAFPTDRTPIADLQPQHRARVAGKVYAVRVQPRAGTPTFELTLVDESGSLTVAFFVRRSLPGVVAGTRVAVEGVVSERGGRLAMLNPAYEILL